MKLKTYLEKNDIDYKTGSAETGIPYSSFYSYANDLRVPRKPEAHRIYIWSGGLVCPNDFYDLPDLSAAPRKAATLPPHITHAHFGGSGRI